MIFRNVPLISFIAAPCVLGSKEATTFVTLGIIHAAEDYLPDERLNINAVAGPAKNRAQARKPKAFHSSVCTQTSPKFRAASKLKTGGAKGAMGSAGLWPVTRCKRIL
jgi:hypothetical protein